jgi:hypothetical protein
MPHLNAGAHPVFFAELKKSAFVPQKHLSVRQSGDFLKKSNKI